MLDTIPVPQSDALDNTRIPPTYIIGDKAHFLDKLAPLIVNYCRQYPGDHPWVATGWRFRDGARLDDVPTHYIYAFRIRPETNHKDRYLCGHPSGHAFRSPNEFLPHFIHLSFLDNGIQSICACKGCDKKNNKKRSGASTPSDLSSFIIDGKRARKKRNIVAQDAGDGGGDDDDDAEYNPARSGIEYDESEEQYMQDEKEAGEESDFSEVGYGDGIEIVMEDDKTSSVEDMPIESNDGFDWLTQETQHQHQFIPPESSSRFELSQGSAFASSSSSSSSVAANAQPKPKAKITIPPSFQTTPTTASYPPTAESFKANPFEDLFNYNVQESGQQSSEPAAATAAAAATVSPQHQKPQIPNPLFRQSDQGIRKDAWMTAGLESSFKAAQPAQPLKQPKQPKPKPRVEPKRFSDVPKFHAPKTTSQQQQQQQQETYRPKPVRPQVPPQHQQQQNNNNNNNNNNKKAFYKHRYHPHEIVWIQTLLNPSTEGDNRRQLRQILKTHTQVKTILSKCLVEAFYWPCVIREVLPGEYRPANIQIEGEGEDTVRIKDTVSQLIIDECIPKLNEDDDEENEGGATVYSPTVLYKRLGQKDLQDGEGGVLVYRIELVGLMDHKSLHPLYMHQDCLLPFHAVTVDQTVLDLADTLFRATDWRGRCAYDSLVDDSILFQYAKAVWSSQKHAKQVLRVFPGEEAQSVDTVVPAKPTSHAGLRTLKDKSWRFLQWGAEVIQIGDHVVVPEANMFLRYFGERTQVNMASLKLQAGFPALVNHNMTLALKTGVIEVARIEYNEKESEEEGESKIRLFGFLCHVEYIGGEVEYDVRRSWVVPEGGGEARVELVTVPCVPGVTVLGKYHPSFSLRMSPSNCSGAAVIQRGVCELL